MVRICNEIKKIVVRKIRAEMKQGEVTTLLETNNKTVHYTRKTYLFTGSIQDKELNGIPKISTDRDWRELCRYTKMNTFATATEVQTSDNFTKMASISTIKITSMNEIS